MTRIDSFVTGSVPAECKRWLARVAALPDVARMVVLPDVHLAGEACVGTAIATRERIYPELLGSDLGCGVATLCLGARAELLDSRERAAALLDALRQAVPTERRRSADLPAQLRVDSTASCEAIERVLRRDGAVELGTLGRGNHFLELQEDEEGALWAMVHTGSRALGPSIQAHHTRDAAREQGRAFLWAQSEAGLAYLADHDLALRYARIGREAILARVAEVAVDLLAADPRPQSALDCHHDAVAREEHEGEPLWVHRKGSVPAHASAPVLIPGSMGTSSVHATGRGAAAALCSSAHGAGRQLTRREAHQRVSHQRLAREVQGVVGAAHPGLVSEAPSAYKDLDAVLRAQRKLVRLTRRLIPRLVHKSADRR